MSNNSPSPHATTSECAAAITTIPTEVTTPTTPLTPESECELALIAKLPPPVGGMYLVGDHTATTMTHDSSPHEKASRNLYLVTGVATFFYIAYIIYSEATKR